MSFGASEHEEPTVSTSFRLFLLLSCLGLVSVPAAAERLVSATIGLNYIGQGHCIVVNSGMDDADVTINIVDAANGMCSRQPWQRSRPGRPSSCRIRQRRRTFETHTAKSRKTPKVLRFAWCSSASALAATSAKHRTVCRRQVPPPTPGAPARQDRQGRRRSSSRHRHTPARSED